jgi:gluconokinase
MIILLMGVSGSGKTTLGQRLARDLGWPFFDADDFHPPANIAKMSQGQPLTDEDRWPWLAAIRRKSLELLEADQNGIITCSALKQIYRDRLAGEGVQFVYLKGTLELLTQRMQTRRDHFMRPNMLTSQLAALEEPTQALVVDVAQMPKQIVAAIRQGLKV